MSIENYSDPITEIFKRVVPCDLRGFSAKHLLKYLETYIIVDAKHLQHRKKRPLMSIGKNFRDSLQLQAVSLYLFTILDQDKDGLVDKNDLELCRRKFLFWLAPVEFYNSIPSLEEHLISGKKRFRHIALLCGAYNQISLQSLEALCIEKLPLYVPSRKSMSAIAAQILLHLLSTQHHIPLPERVITQQDWLANIKVLYSTLHHQRNHQSQPSYSMVSK